MPLFHGFQVDEALSTLIRGWRRGEKTALDGEQRSITGKKGEIYSTSAEAGKIYFSRLKLSLYAKSLLYLTTISNPVTHVDAEVFSMIPRFNLPMSLTFIRLACVWKGCPSCCVCTHVSLIKQFELGLASQYNRTDRPLQINTFYRTECKLNILS